MHLFYAIEKQEAFNHLTADFDRNNLQKHEDII